MQLLVLRPGGMLALNVVARRSSLLDDLIVAVKDAFREGDREEKEKLLSDFAPSTGIVTDLSRAYILKVSDETVNTTLLVIKGGTPTQVAPSQPATSSAKSVVGKVKANAPNASSIEIADSSKLRMQRENAIEDWLKVSDCKGMDRETIESIYPMSDILLQSNSPLNSNVS